MSCTLIFSAKNFDVDAVLAMLSFKTSFVWKQGELPNSRIKRQAFSESGFVTIASEADFDSFKQQAFDVIDFVKTNRQELYIL